MFLCVNISYDSLPWVLTTLLAFFGFPEVLFLFPVLISSRFLFTLFCSFPLIKRFLCFPPFFLFEPGFLLLLVEAILGSLFLLGLDLGDLLLLLGRQISVKAVDLGL